MKNWNNTGKVKTVILVVLFLPNLFQPFCNLPNVGIVVILMPMIFGIIAIPFITRINASIFGQEIKKPTWNDNPLNLSQPLRFFHFGAIFFLSTGLSVILGALFKCHEISQIGLTAISFGFGILLGIKILLKKTKK